MEKKQNVPALRFQGFSGEWKDSILSNEVSSIDTGRSHFRNDSTGNFAILGSTSVIGYDNSFDYEGDFLLVARVGNAGSLYRYSGKVKISDNTVFIQGTDLDFLFYELTHIDLKKLSFGTGQPLVKASTLRNLKISLPSDNEETKRLGCLLTNFDKVINSQHKKCVSLKRFRQAMLTKLFPREGAAEPELRFRGFSGKWKCCRFGDIADIRRGLTYSPSSLRKSGIRVLRASNIQDDTFYIREDDVFVEPDAVNIPMVKNGDILIAAAGGSTRLVGKHAVIYGIEENSVAHGGFMLLASSDYPEFTNALMGANWYRHFVQQFIAGGNGAIGNLNKSDLEEQIVFVPDVAEMEQIGNFFKELDTYISLQQKKLERMQRLKAALLEKLFV